LLATSTFMLGRDDEAIGVLERAHQAYLDAGDSLRAVRCAFWMGMNLAMRGDVGPASGWLGRAQRLLEREKSDCVERGYMLLPVAVQHEMAGNLETAAAAAHDAAAVGERFDDTELFALATHEHGNVLIKSGRVRDGMALLDEAMVAVTTGELSPIVTGIVYCGVILACQEVFEVRRAQEWTTALTRWCEGQPELVAFTGRCLVHRAEIMQLRGAWRDALEEARKASRRFVETTNRGAAGLAFYRQAELHRLQGEFAAADEAYKEASRFGWEPQPGLSQLRLAQGRSEAAAAAIRRVESELTEPLKRAALLPAYVEIMLAVGNTEDARRGCRELEEIAGMYESAMLEAMVEHERGAVAWAEGDAGGALIALRKSWQLWHELEVPYEVARVRVLIALVCRALGDEETAALELEAARSIFAELGASPDMARLDTLISRVEPRDAHGLTVRELEVLRLVAAGKSNRDIASELVISEHTVARHLQNIFAKLGLGSRTAATAFAFEHDLV
jgi:DNA-binding CsgD family transcriptional regulator